MKLELEEPFKSLWRKGYLRKAEKDGRKRVDLVNDNKHRTTISYARYLKSVEIGQILCSSLEVDHINVDCSDDRLENLQVLTKEDHRVKTSIDLAGRDVVVLTCPYCGAGFEKERRFIKPEQTNAFCSSSCNAKYSCENNPNFHVRGISSQLKEQILEMMSKGMSGYRIAKELNISRNTALKYMKIFKSVLQ